MKVITGKEKLVGEIRINTIRSWHFPSVIKIYLPLIPILHVLDIDGIIVKKSLNHYCKILILGFFSPIWRKAGKSLAIITWSALKFFSDLQHYRESFIQATVTLEVIGSSGPIIQLQFVMFLDIFRPRHSAKL